MRMTLELKKIKNWYVYNVHCINTEIDFPTCTLLPRSNTLSDCIYIS